MLEPGLEIELFQADLPGQGHELGQSALARGGSLLVTGQDIGCELASERRAADAAFYQDYLHADFVSDSSSDNTLTGVSGDVIGNGLSITLTALPADTFWPSVISARSGASNVFLYSLTKVGAVRYGTGHKTLYMAFNFEDINSTTTQATIMQRALGWLIPADITPPVATLLAPLGGEELESCAPALVTWTATDAVGVTGVDLYYSDDGGATYPHVIATGLPNTGSASWNPGGLLGSDYRIKLVARDAVALQGIDCSDSSFTVLSTVPPFAQVLSPNGGESFPVGTLVPLTWTMLDTCVGIDSTRVHVSLDGGGGWSHVATVAAPDTTTDWGSPDSPQDSCLVRIEVFASGGAVASDTSDAFFTVGDVNAPSVTVTSPNGGESYVALSTVQIAATMSDDAGVDSVCVAYTIDDGANWVDIACGTLSFPYAWGTPDVVSDSCRVRVRVWDAALNTAVDASDSLFTISSISTVPQQWAGIRHPVLLQNFPNPMTASGTRFAFYLPEESSVSLRVYDLSGRLVRTVMAGTAVAGYHEMAWDGADDGGRPVSLGIYFYMLETPGKREARKLVLVN